MDQRKLLELQTQRGAKTSGFDTTTKTLDVVINECRKNIEDRSEKYRDLEPLEKREAIKQIIIDYVMETKPLVVGYIDGENRPDTLKLVDKLVEDITNYGILTAAMMDERVYEIRSNGKELKVEIEGKVQDLVDREGNIISFESPEQQEIIMKKLLGDVRLTPKDALVNARTLEGFRIAAVHSSAMGRDPNNPSEGRYHAFVLRKFKKSKLNLADIIKFGSMSDNMARFLVLTTAGGLTTICAGPTASGKTSLLNALLQSVPPANRVVLIQNPSEIDMRFKDATNRVYNDVLHLESTEKENPTHSDPTMANLMAHLLRLSPVYAVLGEVRSNREFGMGMMIMSAGHPLYVSLHAENSMGTVMRFLRAYMADSGETIETALPGLVDLLNVVVVQKIMRDGTRKVLQISEVIGIDPDNPNRPLLNDLYIFEPIGDPQYDDAGNIISIPGIHKRVGKLSDRTIRKMRLEGIKDSRFDFLMEEVSDSEVEVYTGIDIERYGL